MVFSQAPHTGLSKWAIIHFHWFLENSHRYLSTYVHSRMAVSTCACNPRAGLMGTGGFLEISDQALLTKWIGPGSMRSSVSKTKWRVTKGIWGDQVCPGWYGCRQKKAPKLTPGFCKPSVGMLTPSFSDIYQFLALHGYAGLNMFKILQSFPGL